MLLLLVISLTATGTADELYVVDYDEVSDNAFLANANSAEGELASQKSKTEGPVGIY